VRDCVAKVDVSSSLPPYARDLNGNLAEQMRIVGPVRGVDTLEPALSGKVGENSAAIKAQARGTLAFLAGVGQQPAGHSASMRADADAQAAANAKPDTSASVKAMALLKSNACLSCHAVNGKQIGRAHVCTPVTNAQL